MVSGCPVSCKVNKNRLYSNKMGKSWTLKRETWKKDYLHDSGWTIKFKHDCVRYLANIVKYAYCFRLAVRTGWTHSNEQNVPSLNKKGTFKLLLQEQIIGPKRGLLTKLACLSGHVSWTQWLNVMCLCVLGWRGWGLLLDLSRPTVTCRARQSAIKGQAELLARDSRTEGSALCDHLLISMFAV